MTFERALQIHKNWFSSHNWEPFPFQTDLLYYYLQGYSGLLNAPTGSGKTYAVWIPVLIYHHLSGEEKKKKGLKTLWITPVRALANDITNAMKLAASELGTDWKISARTGDTDAKERAKQKKNLYDCLVTTPESLHLMLAQKGYAETLKNLETIVIDEWHELLGTKRGVQIELALSRLKTICPNLKIWGISATIGNLDQAMEVLLGNAKSFDQQIIIKADILKRIEINSIIPDEIEKYPWGGHLGVKLLSKIIPIIHNSTTTLIFTNTRSQAEIWYKSLMETAEELAGLVGLHHGSLSWEVRNWVEESLHKGLLKVVVCTSSLDLGVDFRPVETIIQVGGPKGVARFLQRAGRSGHQPGAVSRIYFVPGHSLELIEAAALRTAIEEIRIEDRTPVVRAFDVLCQYLVTLAVSDGFDELQTFREVTSTFAYGTISLAEWKKVLQFITTGGSSLTSYSEFHKVVIENNLYKVTNKRMALVHRLSMGTIVSEPMMNIKYLNGGYIGSVEEFFISKLKIGEIFTFGGKNLEIIMIRNMEVIVRKSNKKSALIPAWMGGRMPLSSQLSGMIRRKLTQSKQKTNLDPELTAITPLLEQQSQESIVPDESEFLIEYLQSKEGHHLFCYTFEGRYVNEGIASLLSCRISRQKPMTFSIAMTDYGFELLCDQPIPIEEMLEENIFGVENLVTDILSGLNSTEMARRKFRDIAHIAGLIFTGFPGKQVKNRHLQASARNFFDVFSDYDPDNLLLRQAYEEVLYDQLDEVRIREALERINKQKIKLQYLKKPSPFCFPILVERFRGKMSNESIEDRVNKMMKAYSL